MDVTGQPTQSRLTIPYQVNTSETTTTGADYVKPDEEITDPGILAGRRIARPPPGEEIVVSGISGRFPNSDDVKILRNNLLNKVDMLDDDTRRWQHTNVEIPKISGKINKLDKLDAGFFGIHQLHSTVMDPMVRMLLERTYEAICDAGLTLEELQGSRTGVFIGASVSETETFWLYDDLVPKASSITGCTRSMLANQLSYFFQFQGPSYTLDTACSSSCYALAQAYKAIRENKCDNALVGGTNLCLHPYYTLQYARLGVLSMNDGCRAFDQDANGFARAEAICTIFLQRAKCAKRILAKIVHAKVNVDGFKELGISCPSEEMQKTLLRETYQEANVQPKDVAYVEAHGTGTKIGDPIEGGAIGTIFCQDRSTILYLGSVKTNIGHTETAAGLCSLVKVILSMEAEAILPNIKFKTPRKGIVGLEEGKMKVVTDSISWPDNNAIVGINGFGFGGANAHVIVEWNKKTKSNSIISDDDIPRLVCVSSRVQEGLQALLDEVRNVEYNVEFIRLIHDIFRHCVTSHDQRGFSVQSKSGEIHRELIYCERKMQDFYCLFGGVIRNAAAIVQELSQIPVVASSVKNVMNIIIEKKLKPPINNKSIYDDMISTITFQIVLVDVLRNIQLDCKKVYGYSIGELTCAYYTECLTLEQILMSCHYIAFARSSSDYSELLEQLKIIIPQPSRKRVEWVSSTTSIFTSAEFLIETINHVPTEQRIDVPNACFLDVGYLEAVNSRIKKVVKFDFHKNKPMIGFLIGLGRLYNMGQNFIVSNLYPEITFPVTRGTPHISPLIKWTHKKNWFVPNFMVDKSSTHAYSMIKVDPKDDYWRFISGHVIDGRLLFPATGYLYMAWTTFANMIGKQHEDLKVVFENVKFLRATRMNSKGTISFVITIHKGTGIFEINESDALVVTGRIYEAVEGQDDIVHISNSPKNEKELLMESHDIYKELKIRGYQYQGIFKAMEEYRSSTAKLKWHKNWIAFMDCMLQVTIVEDDTRNLYVPTEIGRFVLDAPGHINYTQTTSVESIEVHNYKDLNIVKSDHMEIRGIQGTCISRKKTHPVLESYEFVANQGIYSIEEAVRINVQIILENISTRKLKAVEFYKDATDKPLATYVNDAISDEPKIQSDITIISKSDVEYNDTSIKTEKKLSRKKDMLLVMGYNLLQDGTNLSSIKAALAPRGFLMTLENISFVPTADLTVVTKYTVDKKLMILLRVLDETPDKNATIFNLSNKTNWLNELQSSIAKNPKLVVFAQNNPVSGILGFMNCLRQEHGTRGVRCIFVMDSVKHDDNFYAAQLAKGLFINVYKDGTWGTYRHLLLKCNNNVVTTPHVYLSPLSLGDFSTLRWVEGPLSVYKQTEPGKKIIKICCSAMNFLDIMVASGRLSVVVITKVRTEQNCLLGTEFSGFDEDNKRVMGIGNIGALSNMTETNTHLLWNIPNHWSMEDAATVPLVYLTVLYALQIVGRMKPSSTILIHSGTGGVGLAAINVALYYGYKIFTTVGTTEKREYLINNYPQINPENIGNSRDTSFEQMIFEQTGGRGVDFVLNSLAGEKLASSVRCVARGGTYLEIGKFDLAANNQLHLDLAEKQASFHGVMLDKIAESTNQGTFLKLSALLQEAIDQGCVKPLPRNVFEMSKAEDAFRFMAAGKHTGKVVIRIRKEEAEITPFNALPRYHCEPDGVYIVLGGLGGFGLELSDWLILRGARKIVLTSRSGLVTGYQKQRVRIWESYGVQIIVCNETCHSKDSCQNLLKVAANLGPIIGIFNLALVLRDIEFENITIEDFNVTFLPKYKATEYLDILSRIYCPQLRDFVVFSSMSCGRGNVGQTNYGMSNSFMERICENRKKEGLPGLAIQWGAVGDVGTVAELKAGSTEITISGTLQQRIISCLTVMDVFMRQDKPVVSCMIVASKAKVGSNNILDNIMQIIGVRDIKTISLNATLPELGMDSIIAVEIKQTLERDYDIFMTPQDIRALTFADVMKLTEATEKGETVQTSRQKQIDDAVKLFLGRLNFSETPSKMVMELNSVIASERKAPPVVVLPGIEGYAHVFANIAASMKNHAIAYQYFLLQHEDQSITDIATNCLKMIGDVFQDRTFTIVAHSFGACVALEMCVLLERMGYIGKVAVVDGSPAMCYKMCQELLKINSDDDIETNLVSYFMTYYMPMENLQSLQEDLSNCNNFEERIKLAFKNKPNSINVTDEYLINWAKSMLKKIKFLMAYKFTGASKLKSTWKLFRSKTDSIQGLPKDYGLSDYVENTIEINHYKGDHTSILDNEELISDVTAFVA